MPCIQGDGAFHELKSLANAVRANDWNQVAAVYNQPTGTRRIYVNGRKVIGRANPSITLTRSFVL